MYACMCTCACDYYYYSSSHGEVESYKKNFIVDLDSSRIFCANFFIVNIYRIKIITTRNYNILSSIFSRNHNLRIKTINISFPHFHFGNAIKNK